MWTRYPLMRLPAPREWDSRGNLMIEVDETNPPPDAVKGRTSGRILTGT